MTSLLEKAARAGEKTYGEDWELNGNVYRDCTIAVLKAIREPDEGMIEDAKNARRLLSEGAPPGVVFNHIWQAMIDHLLNQEQK